MDFYQNSSFGYENGYYTQNQIPYDNTYYNYSSYYNQYDPPQSSAGLWSYECIPTRSIVAYSAYHDDAISCTTNLDSVQYSVYHSVAVPSPPVDEDLDFDEYDPHPFKGGYDISQNYGKPLDPSDVICYPRSSQNQATMIAPPSPSPASTSTTTTTTIVAETKVEAEAESEVEDEAETEAEEEEDEVELAQVIEEEEDFSDSDGSVDGISADSVQVYDDGAGEHNRIPPGYYGLAEFDICENLFGYWPCLSRMSKKCAECGNEKVDVGDDVDQWKKTADYLFGNPTDPYGGWVDHGSNGYPVYAYNQMQYHYQPASTMYEQADQYAQNSWFY